MWTDSLPTSHACLFSNSRDVLQRTLCFGNSLSRMHYCCNACLLSCSQTQPCIISPTFWMSLKPLKSLIVIALFKPSVRDYSLMDSYRFMYKVFLTLETPLQLCSFQHITASGIKQGHFLYISFERIFAFWQLENGWFRGFIKMWRYWIEIPFQTIPRSSKIPAMLIEKFWKTPKHAY